jgi:hypothetical protein
MRCWMCGHVFCFKHLCRLWGCPINLRLVLCITPSNQTLDCRAIILRTVHREGRYDITGHYSNRPACTPWFLTRRSEVLGILPNLYVAPCRQSLVGPINKRPVQVALEYECANPAIAIVWMSLVTIDNPSGNSLPASLGTYLGFCLSAGTLWNEPYSALLCTRPYHMPIASAIHLASDQDISELVTAMTFLLS